MKSVFRRLLGVALAVSVVSAGAVVGVAGRTVVQATGSCAASSSLSGSGTQGAPFLIGSAGDLLHLATTSALWNQNHHFKQTANINLNGCAWTPIGGSSPHQFIGTFDGGGFSVSGLSASLATGNVGFFNRAMDATLLGINLVDVAFSTADYAGGLVARPMRVTISASSVSGSITGTNYVGGLTGHSEEIVVTNSRAEGTITGRSRVGGISGVAKKSTFEEVAFVGTVNGISWSDGFSDYSPSDVGGLIGQAEDTLIRKAYVSATVSATGGTTGGGSTGGVVGAGVGSLTIEDVASSGQVNGSFGVGGIFGYPGDATTISAVTRTGNVSGTGYAIGGVVGYWDPGPSLTLIISDVWSDSDVTGKFQVGGAVGSFSDPVSLTGVHLLGNVNGVDTTDPGNIGCFVGSAGDQVDAVLNNSFAYGAKRATVSAVPVSCVPTQASPPSAPIRFAPAFLQDGGGSTTTTSVPAPLPPALPGLVNQPVSPVSSVPSSSVAPSTSVRPPSSSVPVPVPVGGVLPSLLPGVSQVLVDGRPEVVEVFVEASTDLVVRGQDFELRLAGECSSGCSIETSADGRQMLTLEERGLANVSGVGFLAGTPVFVWLFSEPRFLGELTVLADGTFAGSVALGDIAPGEHTLQVNGTSFDGRPRTANLGVLVNASGAPVPGPGVLPATGSDAGVLVWVLVLVVLGVGLVALTRRRPVTRINN